MQNCARLMKCVLVAVVLVAVAECDPSEKLASCCTTVNKREITEPVLGYLVQRASGWCVNAVIFQTQSGLYCSQASAPWVRRKIMELRKAKANPTVPSGVKPSSVSLLSIITSTASPSSSNPLSSYSSPPSFDSTSTETSGEGISGGESIPFTTDFKQ
ncbi:uncharacterized protein ACNS7B_022989 [Menidia menidia]|uniref:(Atlantic silverside) hypothetical protein n=1 Tax=Menidia menidia TaxID=238744 RepID=A0A8S4ATW8_9TELE|nr:unnamed protein product [Menidia menidia]